MPSNTPISSCRLVSTDVNGSFVLLRGDARGRSSAARAPRPPTSESEQRDEFIDRKFGLTQDATKSPPFDVAGVVRNHDAHCRPLLVFQNLVTTCRMVDVEAAP